MRAKPDRDAKDGSRVRKEGRAMMHRDGGHWQETGRQCACSLFRRTLDKGVANRHGCHALSGPSPFPPFPFYLPGPSLPHHPSIHYTVYRKGGGTAAAACCSHPHPHHTAYRWYLAASKLWPATGTRQGILGNFHGFHQGFHPVLVTRSGLSLETPKTLDLGQTKAINGFSTLK